VQAMTALSKELSKWRKKRAIPEELATPEDIAAYTLQANQPLHKTTDAGIASVDLMPGRVSVVATGAPLRVLSRLPFTCLHHPVRPKPPRTLRFT
jgi:hypothetical protein